MPLRRAKAGVSIALGSRVADDCADFDVNEDASVTVDELVLALGSALGGC